MEFISFFGDLLIKPDTDLAKFISKAFKILLLYLIAFIIWKKVGGIVVIPKELSIPLAWDFIFSGQVLIPVILVFLTDRMIRLTQRLIFPLLILGIYKLMKGELKRIYSVYKKAIKSPVKRLMAIMRRIGLVSISSNKLKRGPLFHVYEVIEKGIDISTVSKDHLEFLTLLCQITIVWGCLISDNDTLPIFFRHTTAIILGFLITYIPLNLAALYVVNENNEILRQAVKLTRGLNSGNVSNAPFTDIVH